MHYKTMTLALIQERPELYERLRSSRTLLAAMETYAIELKASHHAWTEQIARKRPDSDSTQISGEALELAIQDLRDRLPAVSPREKAKPLSLDAAMSFLNRDTPPA